MRRKKELNELQLKFLRYCADDVTHTHTMALVSTILMINKADDTHCRQKGGFAFGLGKMGELMSNLRNCPCHVTYIFSHEDRLHVSC